MGLLNTGLPNMSIQKHGHTKQGIPNTGIPNTGILNKGILNMGILNMGLLNMGILNVTEYQKYQHALQLFLICYNTSILIDPCIVDYSVEIPTRCSFVIEFIIPRVFLNAQHVSNGTPLIIGSFKLYL
jgi:hypothetical protein